MDTKLYNELVQVCEALQNNKHDRLKEIEDDLINPNMPVAEKVHEILSYISDLYHANEDLCKFIKLQQKELLAKS